MKSSAVKFINEVIISLKLLDNVADIAHHILQPLEKMRRENDLVKVFPQYLVGEDLFGLSDPTVLKIIESVSENRNWLTSVYYDCLI